LGIFEGFKLLHILQFLLIFPCSIFPTENNIEAHLFVYKLCKISRLHVFMDSKTNLALIIRFRDSLDTRFISSLNTLTLTLESAGV